MESNTIFALFMGTRCVRCMGTKGQATPFCMACYYELPRKMRDALWRRGDREFEQAFNTCIDWFKQLSQNGAL